MSDRGGISVTELCGYRLRWKDEALAIAGRIDGSVLSPDSLCTLPLSQVAQTPLKIGRRVLTIGAGFELERLPEGGTLVVPGSRRFFRLAAGLSGGHMIVEGDAGDHAGESMSSGRLEVVGSAGNRLGAGMTGGVILVSGSVGDRVGGPPPGSETGMRGGEIVILGSAGMEAGFRMRRGLIAIAGEAGLFPGYALVAGTLVIGEGRPPLPGLRMRRGTIVFLGSRQEDGDWDPGPHCRQEGRLPSVIVRILVRRLRQLQFPLAPRVDEARYLSYSADHLADMPSEPVGRGEILVKVD